MGDSYTIVTTKRGDPVQNLEPLVQSFLDQGWDLLGEPKQFVVDNVTDGKIHIFAQALTRAAWVTPPLS